MARTLSAQEVFHQLTGVFFSSDDATTGLVATAGTIGTKDVIATAGDVAAMSLVVGDAVRFGPVGTTAEVMIIDGISTETLTGKANLSRTVAIGEVITKLIWTDLGATDENGVNIDTTQAETAVVAGTQKNTYLFINQNVEEALTWALRDFNPENLAQSLGIDEATAAGFVSATPDAVVIDPNQFATLTNKTWKFEGLLEGGESVTGLAYSAKVASANQTLQFVEGQATILPMALRSNGVRAFIIE